MERRRQILEAARKVFARKGFVATRMIDIAGAAHSGKGTLYEYFGSKESLFAALVLAVARDSIETMARTIRRDDPVQALREAIAYIVRVALSENLDLYRLYLDFAAISAGHRRKARKGVEEVNRQLRRVLAEMIRAGQREGRFRAELDPEMVARSLGAAVDGVGVQLALFEDRIDLDAYAETLQALFLGALLGDGALPAGGASIMKEKR